MTKVVHLYPHSEAKFFSKKHFIDDLLSHGIDVEFWDISSLLFPNVCSSNKVAPNHVKKIYDRQDLKKKILSEDGMNTFFVIWFHCRWETLWIYRILFKGRYRTIFFDIGSVPIPRIEIGVFERFLDLMIRGQIKKIVKALVYRAMYNLYGMKDVSFETVFAAGLVAVRRHEGYSNVVKINHYDYDDFLALNNQGDGQKRKNYVVFIDQYQGYHPDPIRLSRKSVNPENYQRGVNHFFDLVENKFGVDVVIAAHPKSDYQDGVFNDREVVKNKTNELVRDCECVLGHGSTSLSFAVLYQKPIMLLCNNELKMLGESSIYPFIETFSSVLSAPVYNVDEVDSVEQITLPTVDSEKYLHYKYEYLTSLQTKGELNGDVFLDFLSE